MLHLSTGTGLAARCFGRVRRARAPHNAWVVAGAVFVATLSPRAGRAQAASADPRHALVGSVRAADESRLVGAHVQLLGAEGRAGPTAVTAADGVFRFSGVPDGAALLVVRRLGFRPETLSVEVPQLEGGPVVVPLQRVAQPLAPVLVRERRAPVPPATDFERRRAGGLGRYISRADIERRNPQRTTDLFRNLAGVTLGSTGPRFRSAGRVGSCDPAYYLDGLPTGVGALDLDAIPPSSIEAIEVYNGAATVPAALRSAMAPGGCGAIAIWSRQGDVGRRRRARAIAKTLDSLDAVVAHGGAFTADQVESAAAALPGFAPMPAYPDSLRDASVSGRVVAEFVVDERGRVAPETVGIVSSSHPLFADAVRDAIAESRFSPAYRQGRVVRQVVHLPVVFEPGATLPAGP